MNGKALDITAVASEGNSDAIFTENDLDADWDTAGATKITLSDEGSTVSGNGGKCVISGGTVLACGSSGMAEGFDSSSTQGFLMQTASASAGTTVTVEDADGNELLSEKVPCSFSSVLVSTPEMKIGDTCKLTVGDTETEMTIDNTSTGGGFGGFGGRGIHGGNGFGGGQMPDRGGFDRNGGVFDGGTADETQDSESTQNGNEPSVTAAATAAAVSLLSTAGNESQDGNATGETASSDPQNGDAPDGFPEDDAIGGMQPPEMPNGAEGDMPSGLPQGNMPGQENAPQAAAAGAPISAETLILLGVSVIVLLVGCAVVICYKRRG